MRHPFQATVLGVEQVTPAMRRLVLGGEGVTRLAIPPGALGPYLKLHVESGEGRRCVRTYSVRRHDPARGELRVDILLHSGGIGAALAAAIRPGESVTLSGPGHVPAEPCASYLLVGDHCALPPIAHILETLPRGVVVRAIVEVPSEDERQPLPSGAAVEVEWLIRPPGAPSRLAAAACAAWPDDPRDLLVWAGAEAAIARAIRRDARRRRLPPSRAQILNYWTLGRREGEFSYMA